MKIITFFLVALALIASKVTAADTVQTQLKGIDTVKLEISISQELVDAGAPGAKIRTMAELQLRKAGLKVDKNSTGPILYITITGCKGPGTENFAVLVNISVNENMKVVRNDTTISSVVWGPDLYLLYLPNGVSQEITDSTEARMNLFVNDWLQANPC